MPRKRDELDAPEKLRRVNLQTVRLGPTPMSTSIKYYKAFKEASLSKTTMDVDLRKLRYFAKFFEGKVSEGLIPSADPRHIDEATILEFLIWMKDKNLDAGTQEKYVQIMGRWLKLFGNDVLVRMHQNPNYEFPKACRDKDIHALEPWELQAVFDAAASLPGEFGWRMEGYLALAFTIGGRPKEIILSHVEDIDLEHKSFFIRHPKGEGSWAHPEPIPMIRGDMDWRIRRFLCERAKFLEEKGIESVFTFVNPSTMKPYSDKSFRQLKKKVEELSGVKFMLKEMRSTLATMVVEDDFDRLPTMSLQLRHKSTDTTRNYYTRINRKKSIEQNIGDLWKDNEIK